MLKQTVAHENNRPVILVNSITKVDQGDEGAVVISGSHGGRSSRSSPRRPVRGRLLQRRRRRQGRGRIAGLAMLTEGTPSCAVSHEVRADRRRGRPVGARRRLAREPGRGRAPGGPRDDGPEGRGRAGPAAAPAKERAPDFSSGLRRVADVLDRLQHGFRANTRSASLPGRTAASPARSRAAPRPRTPLGEDRDAIEKPIVRWPSVKSTAAWRGTPRRAASSTASRSARRIVMATVFGEHRLEHRDLLDRAAVRPHHRLVDRARHLLAERVVFLGPA